MGKRALLSVLLALLFAAVSPNGVSVAASQGGGFHGDPSVTGGGFSGPGIAPITVQQAMTLRDDSYAILRGNITQHLGKDKYLFKDTTGHIHAEIDQDKWGGKTVTPQDTVEISGEIDKDWNSVEIDVDRVVVVK
ncbi:MAG: YgiW/YdeI family stress tolerance OB fold protein [Desulfovibrio sp.]|jgi:uncharacterized protein (TIGR00156 family)|nr:YgiW/YdeI family stress tolerance OB fold protein [Desulfovibrio sp.]